MKLVHLRSFRDLVMLVASSPSMNVVQHFQSGDRHIYFIIGGTLSETFLYYVREEKAVPGKFVIYNTFAGEISFSEKLRAEPNLSSIPIIEIESQEIFTDELLARVGGS